MKTPDFSEWTQEIKYLKMKKSVSRRKFLFTSAGFSALLITPGIWSCQGPKRKKQSYDFETFYVEGQNAPVTRVTPADGNFAQTYFDVSPFSPSGRYLVVSKLPFNDHIPALGDEAEVCVIDLKEQTIETVYATKTWGFQTGTNAQWGRSDQYIHTNDLIDGKAVMIEIDLMTGETTAFSRSMYNVSSDGRYAIGFPLELLNVTQQGYGLPTQKGKNHASLPVGAAQDQGIWRTDLETRECKLLYSIADVVSKVHEPMPRAEGTFYFWHSKYNKQSTRIMQVLRCIFPGFDGGADRNAMVFTLNADGSDVKFTHHDPIWGYKIGGHPNWHPDGEHLIRNMKPDGDITRVCQFKYDGSDFKVLSETFKGIGHPSIEPGGRYVMTDRRVNKDDGTAEMELLLLDVETDDVLKICTVPTVNTSKMVVASKALRVDGHPCWSRDYKRASLQGTYQGVRQLYLVDMGNWIS